MNVDKVDCGQRNPELGQGIPPTLQFRYAFNSPFMNIAEAFFKKYNWESKMNLTTLDSVQQLDDDRIIMYRRHDKFDTRQTTWEQIIVNRQNQSIESDIVGPNPNGSAYIVEKSILRPNLTSKTVQSLLDTYIYDVQGAGTAKVEVFKNQVTKIQTALKFTQWAAEEQ